MKASKLIEELQKLIAENGDIEVRYRDNESDNYNEITEIHHEKGECAYQVNPYWDAGRMETETWDYWILK